MRGSGIFDHNEVGESMPSDGPWSVQCHQQRFKRFSHSLNRSASMDRPVKRNFAQPIVDKGW